MEVYSQRTKYFWGRNACYPCNLDLSSKRIHNLWRSPLHRHLNHSCISIASISRFKSHPRCFLYRNRCFSPNNRYWFSMATLVRFYSSEFLHTRLFPNSPLVWRCPHRDLSWKHIVSKSEKTISDKGPFKKYSDSGSVFSRQTRTHHLPTTSTDSCWNHLSFFMIFIQNI